MLALIQVKAWVNFDGDATLAVRDSHNVASVDDDGTGFYTVNFSNNMASVNYTVSFTGYYGVNNGVGTQWGEYPLAFCNQQSSSSLQAVDSLGFTTVQTWTTSPVDCEEAQLIIFGD